MKRLKLLTLILILIAFRAGAWEYNGRHGWPEQKAPKSIVVCETGRTVGEKMLAESLAGLAAQAVNEDKFDQMVWNSCSNPEYDRLFDQITHTLNVANPKHMDVWSLLKLLKDKGVVKGYVLYKLDKPRANAYAANPNTNYSANVATVYASLLKGVLVDETLEVQAKKAGLKMLKDARVETPEACFAANKSKLNNCSALSVPPSVTNLRDYAIAHKLMLYADKKALIDPVLEWVKPLSPILGWGCGDEYDFTSVIAEWGHYNTATNWCMNLPVTSCVADVIELTKAPLLDPRTINYSDTSSFHTFVMSDGDNVQWTMGNFLHSPIYMGHPDVDKVSLSWTLCPTNLSIASPFTWNDLAGAKTPNLSYLEYGGGYQYPDRFAIKRANRPELLREFAKRINYHLKKLNINIFGFICFDVASPQAQEAFQIYAEEMDNIVGMLAVQYFPYELDGAIYWKTNKSGVDIPVVTSRYSLWNEVNPLRPRCGTPEFVAALINRDVIDHKSKTEHPMTWTIVHAWSNFDKSSKVSQSPAIGVSPVAATENMLVDGVKCVNAEELLWRIRMKYRPEQTKTVINQ